MARHGDKGGAEPSEIHLQNPRRLRSVHDQRNASVGAQRRNVVNRQNEAENIGNHGADHKLRPAYPLFKSAKARFPVKQRRFGNQLLCAELMERSGHGVVLIAGDQHRRPGFCQ